MISFTVNTRPVAKGRPIFGKGNVRTPAKTKAFESKIAAAAIKIMADTYTRKSDKPLKVSLEFGFSTPKSWPKWKKEALEKTGFAHVSKPDLDNLSKTVLDAMNNVVYYDDSQIVVIAAMKHFTDKDYVKVTIKEYEICPSTIKTKKELDEWRKHTSK